MEELALQYIVQLTPKLSFPDLTTYWRASIESETNRCRNSTTDIGVFEYDWMVNRTTGVSRPRDMERVLFHVLKSYQGWRAHGFPIRQPRTEWYLVNASFSLAFENVKVGSRFPTVLCLKSYTDSYKGTVVRIDMEVVHLDTKNNSTSTQPSSSEIQGYHSSQTSVHFPHKMFFPNGGAQVGDTVRVKSALSSGQVFKVTGIALCSR